MSTRRGFPKTFEALEKLQNAVKIIINKQGKYGFNSNIAKSRTPP